MRRQKRSSPNTAGTHGSCRRTATDSRRRERRHRHTLRISTSVVLRLPLRLPRRNTMSRIRIAADADGADQRPLRSATLPLRSPWKAEKRRSRSFA